MNERPDPKSRLIADLFHEDWDSGSASRLALEAAAQVRRRRVLRRGAIAATLSTCALLLAVMVARGSSRSVLKPAIESSPERVPVPLAVQTHKGYEIISDDELIADLSASLHLTVFMITHDLDSLHAICDRVAVIADKKVVGVGTIPQLQKLDHPWINEYFNGPRGRSTAQAYPARERH